MFRCNYVSPLLPFHFAKVQNKSDISKKRTIIHDTYAASTSFMLCELYKNLHGLIDNVHQLQKGFYVTFPKSNIEAVCQPGHQKVFTQSEAPYTPAGPYTKRSFLTRAAGSLLVRSTLEPHSARLTLRAEAFAVAVVA